MARRRRRVSSRTDPRRGWFALLTNNPHDIHSNADNAARTEFGKPLVVSTLTLAIVTGLSVSDVSQNAVANLGWDDVLLTAPVFAGDTIYADTNDHWRCARRGPVRGRVSSGSGRAVSISALKRS